MSGEDHWRPHDVFPRRHHTDFHRQPQRSCAQLPTGQHLEDRSLPAKSKAALQVIRSPVPLIPAVFVTVWNRYRPVSVSVQRPVSE